MIVKNVSVIDMGAALHKINKKYDNNIKWNRFDCDESKSKLIELKRITFTLRCIDSKAPGARRGYYRRKDGERMRLTAACWHVHGDFFDALIRANPSAIINTMYGTIDKSGGNWIDKQVGSAVYPVMLSQLCECNCNTVKFGILSEGLKESNVTQIKQAELTGECWLVQAWGLDQCKTCDVKDTSECGGKNIRSTGKNTKGLQVPL